MEVPTTFILLLLLPILWFARINAQLLSLHRAKDGEKDTIYSLSCELTTRSTGSYRICTCKPQYTTVMSKEDTNWDCRAPVEVGCNYYLGESKQVYLISKPNIKEVIPQFKGNESSIQKIFIWNYRLDRVEDEGHWDEVTTPASRFFALDHGGSISLSTVDLDLNKWSGHAIKIKLGDGVGDCVLAKTRGKIDYPLDVEKFRRSLNISTTTVSPKTTVTIKTTTTVKRETPTRVTSTTPKSGKRHGGKSDDSKAQTIYIVVGVLIAVAFIVTVIIFILRRRRSPILEKVDENSENKLKDICVENMNREMHRDISHLVKPDTDSYEPNGVCNGIIVDRVESFKGTEDVIDRSSCNNSACANTGETSMVMDAYSGMMDNSSSEDDVSEELRVGENDTSDLVANDHVTIDGTDVCKADGHSSNENV